MAAGTVARRSFETNLRWGGAVWGGLRSQVKRQPRGQLLPLSSGGGLGLLGVIKSTGMGWGAGESQVVMRKAGEGTSKNGSGRRGMAW